jgi:hypothetical protein
MCQQQAPKRTKSGVPWFVCNRLSKSASVNVRFHHMIKKCSLVLLKAKNYVPTNFLEPKIDHKQRKKCTKCPLFGPNGYRFFILAFLPFPVVAYVPPGLKVYELCSTMVPPGGTWYSTQKNTIGSSFVIHCEQLCERVVPDFQVGALAARKNRAAQSAVHQITCQKAGSNVWPGGA